MCSPWQHHRVQLLQPISRQGTAQTQPTPQMGKGRSRHLCTCRMQCTGTSHNTCTHPQLRSACPCAVGITQRHTSPSLPSVIKLPTPHQHPVQKCIHTELKGAQTCHAQRQPQGAQHPGSHACQVFLPHPSPAARACGPPFLPLLGAGFGTPFQLRAAICPVLSPPLSSPLGTNSHNSAELLLMARPGSSRAETQPQREPPLQAPRQAALWPQHAHTRTAAESPQRDTGPREQ